ncbi:MAG: 4-hydroxy-tetrahydrodipicolinate synthase [Bacillota bacterium]|nr:4-hydroxy-tetrahydrodipicolinate synthase [Bacillota bacterium]
MGFGEVLTAMVTPFTNDGKVNYEKAQELALYLLDHGSDGIVVGGTTGESPTLSEEESFTLYREVKNAVGTKGTVIGGAGNNCTEFVVQRIKKYNQLGLDGYLSVVPYYNKPTQEGVYKHFEAISDAAECPIIVYNIPGRTGINLCPDTLVRMADLINIKAIKESTGNVDQITEMKMRLPSDFAIYSGDDFMTFPIVAMGGTGVISVASHLIGNEIKSMIQCLKNNDLAGARALHLKYYPVFKGVFCTANPVPVKTALNLLGFELGGFRLPICGPEPSDVAFLKSLLEKFDLFKQ